MSKSNIPHRSDLFEESILMRYGGSRTVIRTLNLLI